MPICVGNSLVGSSGINGDRFYISPDNTTLMLADGASGAGHDGKVAMSECCVRNIERFPFGGSGLPATEYLEKLIWKTNNELIQLSQEKKKYIFGTLVLCVIDENRATFASIGDSSAYIIIDNQIDRVAKTKKSYDNLIQMGLFTEEQLEDYIHTLPEYMWSMFDRFIPMVVPNYAVEEYDLKTGDMIVICCDGISDYVSKDELLRHINGDKMQESVNEIIVAAKENAVRERGRNQYDDITMVLYQH